MTYHSRAALAAMTALALCACATTATPSKTDMVTAEAADAAKTVMTETSETVMAAEMVEEVATDMPAPEAVTLSDMADEKYDSPNETLLYGAMTKFELMTFVDAVSAANLQSALEADTPMTVFAPNNEAFERASLTDDADVAGVLKGHIVAGAMDVAALKAAVAEKGSSVKMTTLAGTELTVYVMSDAVRVAGPSGVLATLTQADMMQSNGVMHQINSVLKPK